MSYTPVDHLDAVGNALLMDGGILRPMDATHAAAIVWSTCHGVISLQLKHLELTYVDWQQVYLDATAAVILGLTE